MNKTLTTLTLSSLLLAGCGGPSDFKAEATVSAADTFAAGCAKCHGDKGQGKWGFLFKIAGSEKSSDELVAKLINGGMLMPSFPNLSLEQKTALAEYIKGL